MKYSIKFSAALLLIMILSLCIGCEGEKGPVGPEGPAGPILTGNLFGFVKLYDLRGNRLADAAGVKVTVVENNRSATTNAIGKWSIDSLQTGTYTIQIEKSGYGIYKQSSYSYVGNGDVIFEPTMFYDNWNRSEPIVYLGQIPTYSVNQITATADFENDEIDIELIFTPALQENHAYIIFIGSESVGGSSVSSDPHNYVFRKIYWVDDAVSAANISILSDDFVQNGIPSGKPAFFIAYGLNRYADPYIDIETGKWYYATLSSQPSNVVSVLVP